MQSILHVRDKLAEIIRVSEPGYAAGFTVSELGKHEVYFPGVGFRPCGPVICIPDSIYATVGRCLAGEAAFREAEILCDVSGGNQATFPYQGDFMNPETKDPDKTHRAKCPATGNKRTYQTRRIQDERSSNRRIFEDRPIAVQAQRPAPGLVLQSEVG